MEIVHSEPQLLVFEADGANKINEALEMFVISSCHNQIIVLLCQGTNKFT